MVGFRKKKEGRTISGSQMPRWMFETRTEAWNQAGLGEQIEPAKARTAWLRLILFSVLIAAVLVLFGNRQDLFPGYPTEARIATAALLFVFGWGFASALGRTITPAILRRMDPATAGTLRFAIKLTTIIVVAGIALAIAGVNASTLALGGAFTAVVVGLAAQQTLGNIFASIVLQSAPPFSVGERVKLIGTPVGGSFEGTVSVLGLFHTSVVGEEELIMVPNSALLTMGIVPLHEPKGINVKARFESHTSPAEVQTMLRKAITVPTLREPSIWLEEIDRNEVVLRISATPVDPDDGAVLAEQILSVTRGSFEYDLPENEPDPDVPHGHA